MNLFLEDYVGSLPGTLLDLGLLSDELVQSTTVQSTSDIPEDEIERTAILFHQKACHALSILEDPGQNPWITLIWPLTREHPALYHAIATLTCFQISRIQPQLHVEGIRHAWINAKILSDRTLRHRMPLDVILAATLAMAFAEIWDRESTSTGIDQVKSAGLTVQHLLSEQSSVMLAEEEEDRLWFLVNTWMCMDVLARFICNDLLPARHEPSWPSHMQRHLARPSRLDSLMGYSTSFFPLMGHVADLVNVVRAKAASRNSPAIISCALELRRNIEEWAPPIHLEAIDDPSPDMTDAIQTAEAYRWATLGLLYQAVPELPNLTSYGEVAQKVLVYLATIPLTSATIIVHIFPLIVAGPDAVEEEDREFVRERWKQMSKRMVTGTVEKCLDVTEEAWKRRDEYLLVRGLPRIAGSPRDESASQLLEHRIPGLNGIETVNIGSLPSNTNLRSSNSNGFPISAAFKRGVDILTRSGCVEYTVRGRLHWLGIMRERNWHGEMADHIGNEFTRADIALQLYSSENFSLRPAITHA